MPEYNPYTSPTRFSNRANDREYLRHINEWESLMSPEERLRIQRYRDMWMLYDGDHWQGKKLTRDDEKRITLNFCRKFIHKSATFLVGKEEIGYHFEDDTAEAALVPVIQNKIWKPNRKASPYRVIALWGGVCGDAFVKIVWDDNFKRVRFIPLNSSYVFPVWDAEDRTIMLACEIRFVLRNIKDFSKRDQIDYTVYREIITPETITVYHGDRLMQTIPNLLGEINVVHIKNLDVPNHQYGIPDLIDVGEINKEINSQQTTFGDIVDYHSQPVTIIKGAKASNLEKGTRKVWGGLPKDADVFNLTLESDLGAMTINIERLKQFMHEIGSMPQRAFGGENAISNTSGVALQVEFGPLLELTDEKHESYGIGFTELNRKALKLYAIKNPKELKVKKYFKEGSDAALIDEVFSGHSVIWPDTLPRDKVINLQYAVQMLDTGLWTRKRALIYLGDGEDADQLLADVDAERAKLIEEQLKDIPQSTEDIQNQLNMKRSEAKKKKGLANPNIGGNVKEDEVAGEVEE